MHRFLIIAIAAALFTAGCVSSSDLDQVKNQVTELQDELATIKRTASSKEEVQNVNLRIAEQTEMLLKSNATLVAKVDEIDDRIQNTQGAIEQSNYRIDSVVQQLAQVRRDLDDLRSRLNATASSAGTEAMTEVNVPAPATPAADPMQNYQGAYRDYQRGNYDLAIEGFQEFVEANPTSDLADNASYWIGESLFSQKKYREAIQQFDIVVSKYPRSDKVPGALLKKGYAHLTLGERAQGIVQLQYVLHEHPTSQEAALARQRLQQLGVGTK